MSVPARSATSRDAAASICWPPPIDGLLDDRLGGPRHLAKIHLAVPAPLQPVALDDAGVLLQRLVDLALTVGVASRPAPACFAARGSSGSSRGRRDRSAAPRPHRRPRSPASVALPLRFGFRIRSARRTMTTRRSPIIGSVCAACDDRGRGDRPCQSRASVRGRRRGGRLRPGRRGQWRGPPSATSSSPMIR